MLRDEPASRVFGSDRGAPIDRYYIEQFLRKHRDDIRGSTLEVADTTYTTMFGGTRVTRSDVLHLCPGAVGATIIADLSSGEGLESNRFDCAIVTQTLNMIYDVEAAVRTIHRILKPGGIVLATMPGISQISRYDMQRWGEYWRFTTASAERAFQIFAHQGQLEVQSAGNVAAAAAYLYGLAVDDVGTAILARNDPEYQLVVTVRALKSALPD